MSLSERVVGYDAREMWLDFSATWPEHRRQQYLYRLDVVKPLSVDTRVWPSIFVSEGRRPPVRQFGYQDSWNELLRLRSALTDACRITPLRSYRVIAITLCLEEREEREVDWRSIIPTPKPDHRTGEWALVGFDVADRWMLSALTNCGFVVGLDDADAMRRKWAPHLNKFHLFTTIEPALSFKQVSDERLKNSHAPFVVFGIWVVKATSEE